MLWLRSMAYPALFPVVFAVVVPLAAARTDHRSLWSPHYVSLAFGWACVAVATVAIGWSLVTLFRHGPDRQAKEFPAWRLVTRGPYARLRNPIYAASLLALIGEVALTGSGTLATYAVAYVVAVHLYVVLHEEPMLAREFRGAYVRYRMRVRRWTPSFEREGDDDEAFESW